MIHIALLQKYEIQDVVKIVASNYTLEDSLLAEKEFSTMFCTDIPISPVYFVAK